MLVDIVPVGDVPAPVLRQASDALRTVYECDVKTREQQSLPPGAYNESRDQYRAEKFIQLARQVGTSEKNIAITPCDLYYHRRNYVFGLAYLDGAGSVISTYRLEGGSDDGVGAATDGGFSNKDPQQAFAERVRKEVVHEIGHTLGLEHCSDSHCVMSFSPTVHEVDSKREQLCGSCSEQV